MLHQSFLHNGLAILSIDILKQNKAIKQNADCFIYVKIALM